METNPNFPSKNANKTVFLAWLLVGTLDILAATGNFLLGGGKNPITILHYISSAIYGTEAFQTGGAYLAILGLLLHYLIAGIWTVFFFVIYRRIPVLSKNRVLTGIGYGVFVWTIMSQIVVRFSNTPKGPFSVAQALIGAAILCVAIGIPLSFMAYRFYYGRK